MAVLAVVALLAAPAGAARGDAPTVVTGKPTQITQTSVRLTGTVNPNGVPARYFFNLLGPRISHDVGAGFAPVQVSLLVTGLLPGLQYDYTLSAVNSDGLEATGQLVRFRTASPPCRVPRLKGQFLVLASDKLFKAGCKLGRVRYRHLGSGNRRFLNRLLAKVVSQHPRAGRVVRGGTKVDLVLQP